MSSTTIQSSHYTSHFPVGILFTNQYNPISIFEAKKSNSSFYKIVVILAIYLTITTPPYLTTSLSNRIQIIIKRRTLLSFFGSYFLSLQPTEIKVEWMSEWKLKKYHIYFTTEEGKKEWLNCHQETQLAFLAHFEKNRLSIHRFPLDRDRLTDENFKMYHETIWNQFIAIQSSEKSAKNVMSILQKRSFTLDLPPPTLASPSFFSAFSIFDARSEDIVSHTKNQALWEMGIILSGSCTLQEDTMQAYITLFEIHRLPLPILTIDEIKNSLSDLALQTYFLYFTTAENWLVLSLEQQFTFNQLFLKSENISGFYYLRPNSIDSILSAKRIIISVMYTEALDINGIWKTLTPRLQEALEARFVLDGFL